MSDRLPSRTALATAYLRAAHQLLDDEPRILDDPVALKLLGEEAPQRIQSTLDRYQSPGGRALRHHVVFRSRFAEDQLAAAAQRGITQYVILGAGFDTFALRQPAWAKTLKILEVDHEGTQSQKRNLIAKAGLELPQNLTFAPIDFEGESLLAGLLRYRFSPEVPTFFSWLGVTMYLNETAIVSTLRSISAFPAGTELVVTFLAPPEQSTDGAATARAQISERVAAAGEPFVSFFSPEAFEAKLFSAGFTRVHILPPEDARFTNGYPKDIPLPLTTGVAYAIR